MAGTVAAAAAVTLVLTGASPAGAQGLPERDPADGEAGEQAMYEALERDLGLEPAQADRLLAAQEGVSDLATDLADTLGTRYGGAWFDSDRLQLVVAVLDQEAADVVADAGARPELVERSYQELTAITDELDDLIQQEPEVLDGALAWGIEVTDNVVGLLAQEEYPERLADLVRRYEGAVVIETSEYEPELTSWLDGGHAYDSCSVGFNASDDRGTNYFLTAGHCGPEGAQTSRNGISIGPVVESWFPYYDDALVRVDNSHWWQGGYVTTHPGFLTLQGHDDSPVGTTLCSSGRTTGWTCGEITGKNQTVNYSGDVVYGSTRHDACAEQGDSGGANVSLRGSGRYAEGMSSGAMLAFGRCLGKLPLVSSRSWFHPVVDSLAYYGPQYDLELMSF